MRNKKQTMKTRAIDDLRRRLCSCVFSLRRAAGRDAWRVIAASAAFTAAGAAVVAVSLAESTTHPTAA
eukprot:CAMPEP_0183586770 /NCGR_PEP_ID=MMETSP0371-20130417/157768_1 /TAXON_ID=268820 /ORGANISM="Peridinium aciculiferum, Strain PAER-2" /LENGTH=67 /DNA_ID=CAMNT_0025797891 /DNA_START=129 /DNA_END=332 /DNA_ORIENTATION=-